MTQFDYDGCVQLLPDMFSKQPEKDTPLSKAKLVARLKQYMVDTNKATMDPNLFFWCTGGNSRVAALLIDIANGEFEMEETK